MIRPVARRCARPPDRILPEAGKAVKARKSAKPKWIERVSVSFRTTGSPRLPCTRNGRGDAIQS